MGWTDDDAEQRTTTTQTTGRTRARRKGKLALAPAQLPSRAATLRRRCRCSFPSTMKPVGVLLATLALFASGVTGQSVAPPRQSTIVTNIQRLDSCPVGSTAMIVEPSESVPSTHISPHLTPSTRRLLLGCAAHSLTRLSAVCLSCAVCAFGCLIR
jgi:hypothetical protein